MVVASNNSSFTTQFKVLLSKTNRVRVANPGTIALEILLPLWMMTVLAFTAQSPGGFEDLDAVTSDMLPITSGCLETATYTNDFRFESTLDEEAFARCTDLVWAPNSSVPLSALMDDVWTSLNSHLDSWEEDSPPEKPPTIRSFATIEAMEQFIADTRGSFLYPSEMEELAAMSVSFPTSEGAADTTLPYPFTTNISIPILDSGLQREYGVITVETALASAAVRARRVENGLPALEEANFEHGFLWTFASAPFPRLSEVDFSSTLVPFYLLFGFIPSSAHYTVAMVTEKERGITAAMTAVGMTSMAYFFSWAAAFSLPLIVTALLVALICTTTSVMAGTSFWVLFFVVLLFGSALIPLAMIFSVPFGKSKTAGGVVGFVSLAFFGLFALATRLWFTEEDWVPWAWTVMLVPHVAFGQILVLASTLQSQGSGLTWDSLDEGNVNSVYCIVMLAVDVVLYYLILFWASQVFPGSGTGTSRSPLFCFSPSFWRSSESRPTSNGQYSPPRYNEQTVVDPLDASQHSGRDPSIVIRDVTKTFKPNLLARLVSCIKKPEPEVKAVNNYSLDLYQGEVLALLGHNGAGKSTLINLLSAIHNYDSGTISMLGLDPAVDYTAVHRILGVCPQQDVLWDELTAEDNLRVYAGLKGLEDNGAAFTEHLSTVLTDVCLTGLNDSKVGTFSGGMKRKLSVAIALLGDAKIVLLDEPTTGMDPASRKDIWGLFQNYKKGRTVILTTHSMEEADLLGDRVAIMGAGELLTLGSSSFLKQHFGSGYTLALAKAGPDAASQSEVLGWLGQFVTGAKVSLDNNEDMHALLPLDQVSKFPDLFAALKQEGLPKLGMSSFGISMTTLEEVFLKVAVLNEEEETASDDGDKKDKKSKKKGKK